MDEGGCVDGSVWVCIGVCAGGECCMYCYADDLEDDGLQLGGRGDGVVWVERRREARLPSPSNGC